LPYFLNTPMSGEGGAVRSVHDAGQLAGFSEAAIMPFPENNG
jgi:hypothetical protein